MTDFLLDIFIEEAVGATAARCCDALGLLVALLLALGFCLFSLPAKCLVEIDIGEFVIRTGKTNAFGSSGLRSSGHARRDRIRAISRLGEDNSSLSAIQFFFARVLEKGKLSLSDGAALVRVSIMRKSCLLRG